MTTVLTARQFTFTGIGPFPGTVTIRLWVPPHDPDGWLWAAIADEEMTDWIRGEGQFETEAAALAAAIAHVSAMTT